MKCSKQIGLLIMTIVAVVRSIPSEMDSRSTTPYRDRRRITDDGLNSTSLDLLDVRTPPRIREKQKQILKHREEFEPSHAGVAIPVDDNTIMAEKTTNMKNIYNVEHPTTDNTISTSWILLSSLSSTTLTPLESNNVERDNSTDKKQSTQAAFDTSKPKRVTNPYFKKRVNIAISEKPFQKVLITEIPPVKLNKDMTNLTRVKASELNKAVIKRNSSQNSFKNDSTEVVNSMKETKENYIISSSDVKTTIAKTDGLKKNILNNVSSSDTVISKAPVEAKEVETELVGTVKKKKNSTKRKKNKNRRRKPTETAGNTVAQSKPTKTTKQKPISTQIYSYLSREVIPTVGVGLVGLMVTAGLASYFFYPFGVARRSSEVDRKDYYGDYYYKNELAVPEEEAIGKVIAGMSINTLYSNSFQQSKNKDSHSKVRYRFVDKKPQVTKALHGSVEDVPLTYNEETGEQKYNNNYQTIDYSTNSNENKLFVAGPEKIKDVVTPVSVPEHGPRNLEDGVTNSEDEVSNVGNEVTEVKNEEEDEAGEKKLAKPDIIHGPRYLSNKRRKRSALASKTHHFSLSRDF